MRNINIKRLLLSSSFAALGPSFGLAAHYLFNSHALWGVMIGVFSSSLLIQLFGLNKSRNDGTASVAGGEGSSGGGGGGTIDIDIDVGRSGGAST